VTGDRTSAPQRPVVRAATLRERAVPLLGYGTSFQVRVLRNDDEAVLLILFGELDVTSMVQFEQIITEVLSGSPKELIFDLSQSQFISAQGYAAIGHCSMEVPVRVRSRTALAAKVLAIYGYDRVTVATDRGPDVDLPC
jgi:anti-anti-sigma regulatory factor